LEETHHPITHLLQPGCESWCRTASIGLLLVASLLAGGCQSPRSEAVATGSGQIFDEHVNGKTLVNDALVRAKVENKRVILLFGANWCPYCRQLHGLMESEPAVRELVEKEFVVVPIDVGTSARNRNTILIDRYGATVFTDGTPSVVVVDAAGKRLAPTGDNPWSAKNPIEAQRVMAFLNGALR